ncbi:unnamed protein product [Durusdinium trenchii]|uniref:Transmembrane protein n=2 Tax=Durusdinium trenchii TaxID=1381693 RepID=A0ABP0JGZ8_9DINO
MAMEPEEGEAQEADPVTYGEGSVASIGTRRTRLSYATCQSEAEDKAEFLDFDASLGEELTEEPSEASSPRWWNSVMQVAADRRAQNTAAVAVGGYLTLGIAGGTSGLLAGGSLGLLAGLGPAVFTAGLSVPVGAALGAGTGLCIGASVGGTVGAVGGVLVGQRVFYRRSTGTVSPDSSEMIPETVET